jgi:hypothetical protein
MIPVRLISLHTIHALTKPQAVEIFLTCSVFPLLYFKLLDHSIA